MIVSDVGVLETEVSDLGHVAVDDINDPLPGQDVHGVHSQLQPGDIGHHLGHSSQQGKLHPLDIHLEGGELGERGLYPYVNDDFRYMVLMVAVLLLSS